MSLSRAIDPARQRDRFLTALAARPLVMGILNVTPDSFSDGGRFEGDRALPQALRLVAEGADSLDIGGESTRPGAAPVEAGAEAARVLPVIRAVAASCDLPVSVDTYKAAVARQAVAAGAAIVNDVWGLQRDPGMAAAVAETGAAVVVMHNRDTVDPALDILDDIDRFFDRSLALARAAGIPDRHILLDPGIGFGKDLAQNLACLNGLRRLGARGFPLLLGLSRKRMFGDLLGRGVEDRLPGTLAANLLGVQRGVRVIRVHDVAPHVDALALHKALEESA